MYGYDCWFENPMDSSLALVLMAETIELHIHGPQQLLAVHWCERNSDFVVNSMNGPVTSSCWYIHRLEPLLPPHTQTHFLWLVIPFNHSVLIILPHVTELLAINNTYYWIRYVFMKEQSSRNHTILQGQTCIGEQQLIGIKQCYKLTISVENTAVV